ncbi:hypothetical protein Tco_0870536, partial [Tanacetum coccineum]
VDPTKEFLSSRFSLKDMGNADVILVSSPMDTTEKLMPNNVGKLSSWISNTKDNSSTSGWVFLLGGGVISWASKKQTCITGSTMKSEFVALVAAGKEAKWLRNQILQISLWSKPIAHVSVRCDSAATLAMAYSQMYNGKSRHLGVKHNMIRELITKMCLEPAEKEDEVFTSQWLISSKKMLSKSMNKEEPPMYSNMLKGLILNCGFSSYRVMGLEEARIVPGDGIAIPSDAVRTNKRRCQELGDGV